MPREIVLLTGAREAPHLAGHLRVYAPGLTVRHVATRAELDEAFAVEGAGRRLIAFTTNVVVPGRYLAACEHGGYNFHPGPPSYPGVYPESFAVWEDAKRFGATAHRMLRQVDAGPIVATEWFDVPADCGRMYLATLAFEALVRLFGALAEHLACRDSPPPETAEKWSGPVRLRAAFDAMCRIEPGISADEYRRRYRAFGEGPFQDLHLMVHGHRFKIDNPWTEADLKKEMGR
jgi:methionyl-tRNA formyltransferase